MNILILVTGSISAYKAVDIANSLRHKGHEVKIACTKAALQFIPKVTFGSEYAIQWLIIDVSGSQSVWNSFLKLSDILYPFV